MKIINRIDNKGEEIRYSKIVRFLYNTVFGRVLLKLLANKRIASLVGWFLNTKLSSFVKDVVIKKQQIDMSKFKDINYDNYNKFFTRKYKDKYLKVTDDKNIFISPCDSKLMILNIDDNSYFDIKNSKYKLQDIIKDDSINEFKDGYVLIFRLEVSDYHRYCFVDDGIKSDYQTIDGILHTVQPIAYDKYKVFHQNSREWCMLHTKNFGNIIEVEVGALLVGKIVNNKEIKSFNKGDEKGFFEFGGSTILLFVHKDMVLFDEDILRNSQNGNETIVKYGEKIGIKKG